MHRLPSKSVLWRFRFAAWVVIIKMLGLLPAFGILGYGVWKHDVQWIQIGGGVFAAILLLLIFNMLLTSRLRCPLCMVPPLQNRGCSKHRDVKRIFGSHRLEVALSILIREHFTCPYCGEKTAMEARDKGR